MPCKKNLTMRHRIHTIGRDKTNLDIPDHNTVSHDLDWSAERNTSCIISSNHCPVRYLNRHHLSARFCLTSDGKASSYNNILLLLCKCRQKLILIRHCNCCLSRRSHIPQQMILGYSLCSPRRYATDQQARSHNSTTETYRPFFHILIFPSFVHKKTQYISLF